MRHSCTLTLQFWCVPDCEDRHCIFVNLVWYSWHSEETGFLSQCHLACLARFCSALSAIAFVSIVVFFSYYSALWVVIVEVSIVIKLIVTSTGRQCLVIMWARINAR